MSVTDTLDFFLTHRCAIQRGTQARTDPYGDGVVTWEDRQTDVPCRLFEQTEKLANDESKDAVLVTNWLLLVSADTDILEHDRVKMTVDGTEHTFMVLDVIERQLEAAAHHKSVPLLTVAE